MRTTYDIQLWLEDNMPVDADDASDLEHAIEGDGRGRYRSKLSPNGIVVIRGPNGNPKLALRSEAAKSTLMKAIQALNPDVGTPWEGTLMLERAMRRND